MFVINKFVYYLCSGIKNKSNMNKEVQEFISRLKTVKSKACDERVTVKTIYDRAAKGIYEMLTIDGVKFIVEPKKN